MHRFEFMFIGVSGVVRVRQLRRLLRLCGGGGGDPLARGKTCRTKGTFHGRCRGAKASLVDVNYPEAGPPENSQKDRAARQRAFTSTARCAGRESKSTSLLFHGPSAPVSPPDFLPSSLRPGPGSRNCPALNSTSHRPAATLPTAPLAHPFASLRTGARRRARDEGLFRPAAGGRGQRSSLRGGGSTSEATLSRWAPPIPAPPKRR